MKASLSFLALVFAVGIALGGVIAWTSFTPPTPVNADAVSVWFCPQDDCATQYLLQTTTAKQSIDVAIYSFTLDEIRDALVLAHNSGVRVRVVMDAGQAASQYSADEDLVAAGIAVRLVDLDRGILHHKFSVIDGERVLTGSFNYSQNADQYNRENLVLIENPSIAGEYATEFESLWQSAE